MSFELISLIVQFLSALAVILSLIYVARQLAQNTEMMKTNAAQDHVQRNFDIVSIVIENKDFSKLWLQSREDFDSLDEADKNRMIFFERRAIIHWESMYQMHMKGLLPDSNWNELKWLIQNFGMHQGLRQTWNIFKNSFEIDFQNFIEEQFAKSEKK
jgi:hypothetical protein